MAILLACLLQAGEIPSPAESFDLRLRQWHAALRGTVKGDGELAAGTMLDLGDDLGVDGREWTPSVELVADLPRIGRFAAGYWRGAFDGTGTSGAGFLFHDRLFAPAEEVDTRVRLDVYSFDYEYRLLRSPVDLGILAGVRLITGKTELESASESGASVMHRPMLLPGVRVGADLTPWLRVEGTVEGIAFTVTKLKARYWESAFEVVANPWKGLLLGLGYRYSRVDLESLGTSTNFDLDATLDGMTLSVGYRF